MARKKINLEDRIKPVSEMTTGLSALLYGRSGTGKTTLSSTFPKPMLLLDVNEKGTDSISDIEGIDVLTVEAWSDFEDVYWWIKDQKYKTVVVDAISSLQDFALKKVGGEGPISKRTWGEASSLMKTWIVNYRDLIDHNINVVFLAHDRTTEAQETEDGEMLPSVGPRVMPSVASVLTASVQLIGNTFIKEEINRKKLGKLERTVDYCLRIGPHAFYETKIRQPKSVEAPAIVKDPTYQKLHSLIHGENHGTQVKKVKLRKRKL